MAPQESGMQGVVDACFQGVKLADFQLAVRFVTTVPVDPPEGFESAWSVFDNNADPDVLPWLQPHALQAASAYVFLVDVLDEAQTAPMCRLVAHIDAVEPELAPPMLCVPVTPSQEQPDCATLQRGLEPLLQVGIDDIVLGEPRGFELVINVRATLAKVMAQMEKLEAEMRENIGAMQYRDLLATSIHHTLWEYLQQRIAVSLPPVDYSLRLQDGVHFGGYTLGKKLGAGKFGTVYEVSIDAHLTSDVPREVMKVVDKSIVRDLQDLKWVSRGLEVMDLLSSERWRHPNIIQKIEVLHGPEQLFIRMEHGGQDNLYRLLCKRDRPGPERKSMSTELLQSIAVQVAVAVVHMHTGPQVCHRDIKPENFITRQATQNSITVKLADFDLAMINRSGRKKCQSICGSFPFMAPEVVLGSEYDGIVADVWGMGMVMLELLCSLRIVERVLKLRAPNPNGQEVPDKSTMQQLFDAFNGKGLASEMLQEHGTQESQPLQPLFAQVVDGMLGSVVERRWTADQVFQAISAPTLEP